MSNIIAKDREARRQQGGRWAEVDQQLFSLSPVSQRQSFAVRFGKLLVKKGEVRFYSG